MDSFFHLDIHGLGMYNVHVLNDVLREYMHVCMCICHISVTSVDVHVVLKAGHPGFCLCVCVNICTFVWPVLSFGWVSFLLIFS